MQQWWFPTDRCQAQEHWTAKGFLPKYSEHWNYKWKIHFTSWEIEKETLRQCPNQVCHHKKFIYSWNKTKIQNWLQCILGQRSLSSRSYLCVATKELANRPSGYDKARYKEIQGSCPMGHGCVELSPLHSLCEVHRYPCKHWAKPEAFYRAAFPFSNYSGTNCFESRVISHKNLSPSFLQIVHPQG